MSDFDFESTETTEDERMPLVKAHFIGRDETQSSNVKQPEDEQKDRYLFERAGVIDPPYPPEMMVKIFEHSNALRPSVDSYCVNIDGNGHRFEPVIDLDAEEAREEVKTAIFLERLAEVEDGDEDGDPGSSVSIEDIGEKEVDERIKSLQTEMLLERQKIESFFSFCTIDRSFIRLRKDTRQDHETMGNGYWEAIRNNMGQGELVQFNYIPAFTVRLLPADDEPTEVEMQVKRTVLTMDTIRVSRRFRRYVQIFQGRTVYFKEFGDPRVLSSKTGRYYKTIEQLKAKEPEANPATEILHYKIHSSRSPYGVPRWIGTLISVLGSRQSEEVNFLYFENKSVPPLAVICSGGRLSKDSRKTLEDHVAAKIKGKRNFHKILVLEAMPTEGGALEQNLSKMQIKLVPLTMAQHNDALFQKYDERNMDKIGMSFRLPRLLRGDVRDFNRATADASLAFAETQVFAPEREDFDWIMNRYVLTDLGIKFWKFASNSPKTRDPLDLGKIIVEVVKASIITPEEARELVRAVFNRDFKKIDEIWTKIPPELLKSGIVPKGEEPPPSKEEEDDTEGLEDVEEEEDDEEDEDSKPDNDDDDSEEEEEDDGEDDNAKGKGNGKGNGVEKGGSYGKGKRRRRRKRNLRHVAKDLIRLRDILKEEERQEHQRRQAVAQQIDEMPEETIKVPAETMRKFFEDDDGIDRFEPDRFFVISRNEAQDLGTERPEDAVGDTEPVFTLVVQNMDGSNRVRRLSVQSDVEAEEKAREAAKRNPGAASVVAAQKVGKVGRNNLFREVVGFKP